MINLVWDPAFKRKYKKIIKQQPELKPIFWNQIEIFTENPYDIKLKTHKLTGKLKGYSAFSINFTYRIVFRFIDDNQALLIDFGTHADVY